MAVVEIDEGELAAKNRVIGFVQKALADPKQRLRVLEIQKGLDPSFTAPELEQRAYVDERLGSIEKLIRDDQEARRTAEETRDAARAKAELEQNWLRTRQSVRAAGYTEEGIGELESFMEKNGIVDHGIALPAFEKLHPPPAPIASGDNRWGFFDAKTTEAPDLKPLFEGRDEDFTRAQIASTLSELRGQR
jgi:hypothetical protein